MPFIRTYDRYTQLEDGFIWEYRPDEIVDLSIITNTPKLQIRPCQITQRMLPVPSLATFNSGHLIQLEIHELDVSGMDRVPESVRDLRFVNTTLSNINQIRANWSNIICFELNSNKHLNHTHLMVPDGIQQIRLESQIFKIVRLPSTLEVFETRLVMLDMILGCLPSEIIDMVYTTSPYKNELIVATQMCNDEISNSHESDSERIYDEWHRIKINYIKEINDKYNYGMLDAFRLMPGRVINPYDHREEPIVASMFLSSNIVRRASEFMIAETIVG